MSDVEGSIAVLTDAGLEIFGKPSAGVDELGMPQNLMPGTEYAVLNDRQTNQYFDGKVELTTQDNERRDLGAFVLTFTNPNSQVLSQLKTR
jgi:hypothetical protein